MDAQGGTLISDSSFTSWGPTDLDGIQGIRGSIKIIEFKANMFSLTRTW